MRIFTKSAFATFPAQTLYYRVRGEEVIEHGIKTGNLSNGGYCYTPLGEPSPNSMDLDADLPELGVYTDPAVVMFNDYSGQRVVVDIPDGDLFYVLGPDDITWLVELLLDALKAACIFEAMVVIADKNNAGEVAA